MARREKSDPLSGVPPRIRRFLDSLNAQGGPPIYTLTPEKARGVLSAVQAGEVVKPEADIEDRTLPGGPTGQIPVRIVRPRRARGPLPVILYFHGGGWVLGDKETHDRLVRELATGCDAAIVFVDYNRSPEARYPVAIEQAYAATQWLAEKGDSLGLDTSKLVLAGDSVGGNMVAVVTLLAKQRGGPAIDFQVLFYPVTDAHFETDSYRSFAEGYWLTREAMRWFWDSYLPDVGKRDDPMVCPLRASLEQLRGLPPALVITNELDVLRDEGEAYARKLTDAGVAVTATRCIGAIHDLVMLNPLADAPVTRGAIRQAISTLREVLGTERIARKPGEAERAGVPSGAEAPSPGLSH